MTNRINVHLLASQTSPDELAGKTVVVIDVLRATTTITYALASGAKTVIPCLTVEDAWRIAGREKEPVLLGGERGGLPIDGFDLANSPSEYTMERIKGQCIVFTTTNGTKAMMQCRLSKRTLIGAFANLSALATDLEEASETELLCAGTRGEIAREDVLLAGAIVQRITGKRPGHFTMNDQAAIAADAWGGLDLHASDSGKLASILRETRGGRRLLEIGLERDIEMAARIDQVSVVPELDPQSRRIRRARQRKLDT